MNKFTKNYILIILSWILFVVILGVLNSFFNKNYFVNDGDTIVITTKNCEKSLSGVKYYDGNNYCSKKNIIKYFSGLHLNTKVFYYSDLYGYQKKELQKIMKEKNINTFPVLILNEKSLKLKGINEGSKKVRKAILDTFIKNILYMNGNKNIKYGSGVFITKIGFWKLGQENMCNDGKDNNGDGKIDANDPTCSNIILISKEKFAKINYNNGVIGSIYNAYFGYHIDKIVNGDKKEFNKIAKFLVEKKYINKDGLQDLKYIILYKNFKGGNLNGVIKVIKLKKNDCYLYKKNKYCVVGLIY